MIFFDLIEGNGAVFYEDGTYLKFYDKSQIKDILIGYHLDLEPIPKLSFYR